MTDGATYWGVLCRSWAGPIAFDARPCNESRLWSANTKPGAIRCFLGHNHIYFPRDFRFFPSTTLITDATMQDNRAAYEAINPSVFPDMGQAVSLGVQLLPEVARLESLAPDAPRCDCPKGREGPLGELGEQKSLMKPLR